MMKLLLFSDLHADAAAARRLVKRSGAADLLVGAGDFGNVRRHVQVCLDVLREIDKPAVLVAGNNETTAEVDAPTRNPFSPPAQPDRQEHAVAAIQ
jgi:uncharacterized protein